MSKYGGSNRRSNIFSYPSAQLRMILIFALLASVYATANFYVSRTALSRFVQEIQADATLSEQQQHDVTVSFVQRSRDLDLQMSILTLLSLIMIFLACLVVSHRVAGPVFHLKSYMRRRLDGTDERRNIKFRKNDFFDDLATAFNEFQDHYLPESEVVAPEQHPVVSEE